MEIFVECNECNRRRLQNKQALHSVECNDEQIEEDAELKICENCGKERFGSKRPFFDDKWICDICVWQHATGREIIKI